MAVSSEDSQTTKEGAYCFRDRPILTPKTVLPIFFAIGIIFAPIGGLLLWASASVSHSSMKWKAALIHE